MHWQLTGLRSSCAKPPRKKVKANQSFFMVWLFRCEIVGGSAEGEGIHMSAGIEELDLKQVFARRGQPDQLVQPVRVNHAAAVCGNVRAVLFQRRLSVDRNAKAHRTRAGFPPQHQVQVTGVEAQGQACTGARCDGTLGFDNPITAQRPLV
jgi:hypothetical protein